MSPCLQTDPLGSCFAIWWGQPFRVLYPRLLWKLDMTSRDIPHVFLAFFATVTQCFKSALVVVFLLRYSVLPRNTKISGLGFVFWQTLEGSFVFPVKVAGWVWGEGWRKEACKVLVRVWWWGRMRCPGYRDVNIACHTLFMSGCSFTLRWHRLVHRPGPRCAKPCPRSSRQSNCPLLFTLYVA